MAPVRIPSFAPGLLACLLLAGCAGGAGPLPAGLLETASLRKPPPLPEAQLPPRKVALRLHAAKRLNLDPSGQPLALLVRIYKLRQRTAFDQAPYSSFLSSQAEREAGWLGAVALFHSPQPQGWRLAFAATEAEQGGVTIGLHACAMSANTAGAARPLQLVRCQ